MTTADTVVGRGTGNVFADLRLPDADAHLVKVELVCRLAAVPDGGSGVKFSARKDPSSPQKVSHIKAAL